MPPVIFDTVIRHLWFWRDALSVAN